MNPMLVLLIAFTVAVDILITVLVLRRAKAKRAEAGPGGASAGASGIPNLPALLKLGQEMHERIGEQVRMNWSGDPMSLPGVIAMAVDEVDQEARARGLELDRQVLKKLVETSIEKHRIAKTGVIREAMKQVA